MSKSPKRMDFHNSKLLPLLALLLLTLFTLQSHPNVSKNYSETSTEFHICTHAHVADSSCRDTLYPDLCVSTVASFPENRRKSMPEIISATINVTMTEIRESASNCSSIRRKLGRKLQPLDLRALDDCLELFSDSITELRKVLSDLSASNSSTTKYYDDLLTLLSGAMTNQATCLDGFAFSKNNTRKLIEGRVRRISKHFSNCLAMTKNLKKSETKKKKSPRSLSQHEFPEYGGISNGFPTWLTRKDRRLLQTAANQTKADLVVAKDGSGNFTTINDALNAAPNRSTTRFVIYIKTGAYFEYIDLGSSKTMIMLLGDGIGNTSIKGNRSVVDGWTTFRSATVGEFFLFNNIISFIFNLLINFFIII
ncbi:pectinesterase 2-like [Primulina tabacum]|uniref:pectinesterase 2-like n=1 Tax=Primulina tabacum TaxID=48773 RepID=UPI003F5A4A7A